MNKISTTRTDVWARGLLYTGTAMIVFLLSDPGFQAWAPAGLRTVLGMAGAGAVACRAFIDNSTARAKQDVSEAVAQADGDQSEAP